MMFQTLSASAQGCKPSDAKSSVNEFLSFIIVLEGLE
jgi:hypothetical protein